MEFIGCIWKRDPCAGGVASGAVVDMRSIMVFREVRVCRHGSAILWGLARHPIAGRRCIAKDEDELT